MNNILVETYCLHFFVLFRFSMSMNFCTLALLLLSLWYEIFYFGQKKICFIVALFFENGSGKHILMYERWFAGKILLAILSDGCSQVSSCIYVSPLQYFHVIIICSRLHFVQLPNLFLFLLPYCAHNRRMPQGHIYGYVCIIPA